MLAIRVSPFAEQVGYPRLHSGAIIAPILTYGKGEHAAHAWYHCERDQTTLNIEQCPEETVQGAKDALAEARKDL
jgi:hypothetical protein